MIVQELRDIKEAYGNLKVYVKEFDGSGTPAHLTTIHSFGSGYRWEVEREGKTYAHMLTLKYAEHNGRSTDEKPEPKILQPGTLEYLDTNKFGNIPDCHVYLDTFSEFEENPDLIQYEIVEDKIIFWNDIGDLAELRERRDRAHKANKKRLEAVTGVLPKIAMPIIRHCKPELLADTIVGVKVNEKPR
jgi:hypothetical protein